MSNYTAGSVTWNLDVDDSAFNRKVASTKTSLAGMRSSIGQVDKSVTSSMGNASRSVDNFGSTVRNSSRKTFSEFASSASSSLNTVSDGIGHILSGIAKIGVTGSVGLGSLIMYGFKSAAAVQSSAAGINALTANSKEANKVIAKMIEYVQGKPFDRLDTIQAARNMLAFGASTKQIPADINNIGKAVLLTNGSWSDLTQIYGKVISQGRLTTEQFDELSIRGINLSKILGPMIGKSAKDVRGSLGDTVITAEQFRKAMSLAIPDKIIKEQSGTIDNRLLTLKASFRNLAGEVLGINWDQAGTSKFIQPGGTLDRLLITVNDLTKALKTPEMKAAFTNLGKSIADLAEKGLPVLLDGFKWIANNIDPIAKGVGALAIAFVVLKTASFGLQAAKTVGDIYGASKTAAKGVKSIYDATGRVVQGFNDARIAQSTFSGAAGSLGGKLRRGFDLAVGGAKNIATTVGGIASKTVNVTVSGAKAAATTAASISKSMALAAAASSASGIRAGLAWVASAAAAAGAWALNMIRMLPYFIGIAIGSTANAAIAAGAWIAGAVATAAAWVVANAAILGVVGLIIAAVAGAAFLIVSNWKTITAAASAAWNWIKGVVVGFVGWLGKNWPLVLAILTGPIGITTLFIVKNFDKIKSFIGGVVSAVAGFFSSGFAKVRAVIGGVLNFVAGIPGKIGRAFGNFGHLLYDKGRDLIQGLINGAGSLLGKIGNFFLDKLPGFIREPFKKALGIHSPSKVFAGYGANIGQGLVNGLSATHGLVDGAMKDLSNKVALDTTMNLGSSQNGSGAVVGSTLAAPSSPVVQQTQPNITIKLEMSGIMTRSRADMREVAKEMLEAVNEELRARRLPEIGNGALNGRSAA